MVQYCEVGSLILGVSSGLGRNLRREQKKGRGGKLSSKKRDLGPDFQIARQNVTQEVSKIHYLTVVGIMAIGLLICVLWQTS